MSQAEDSDRVAKLLERLLTDGSFRREFRRDPVAVCRAGGLAGLADELEETSGSALQTLELRESKSSLAGVLVAAAAEGVGAVELLRYLDAQQSLPPEVAAPVHAVLTSPNLQAVAPTPDHDAFDAVGGAGAGAHAVDIASRTPVEPEHHEAVADAAPAEHAAEAQSAAAPPLQIANVDLSAEAQQALGSGAADPRFVQLLTTISADHRLAVGSVDGGIDITSVDGEPVSASNIDAREVAVSLGDLDPSLRPTEIGTPWPISGASFVSGPDYEDHIHLAYDQAPEQAQQMPPPVEAAPAAGSANVTPPDDSVAQSTAQVLRAVDPSQHAAPVQLDDAAAELPDAGDAYPGDDASKEQIAAWMARQAHKAGLPGELPVMAGLVESGLTNVQGGDRDSVGFFQMRTGIWDEGAYQGFQNRPALQLKWFIDHALAVKQQRIAGGDRTFLHDSSQWGNWIADVERPAEEYRGRYQLRLDEAQHLLHTAGPPQPQIDQEPPVLDPDPAKVRELAALAVAKKYLGTPYQWGGESPSTGFDCSGLMQYAYHQAGVDLPRVSEDQVNVGLHVDRDQLEPGDLVFFQDSTGDVHHVGMYVGHDKFLHAPHTGDVVKISSLSEPYYTQQFIGGRRVGDLAAAGAPLPQVPGLHVEAAPVPRPAETPPAPFASAVMRAVAPAQEANRALNTVQFLPAVDPEQAQQARVAEHVAPEQASASAADQVDAASAVSDAYPGDGASREQIAAWMGDQAEKAGLPRELPVMASLVESGLTNVQGGDRDSVGFFQMRTGIWDEGPYAGYQQHPELQLKWFIDQAVAVRDERLHRGDDGFLTDPSRWGDWVADVERPAEEYRGRYQLRLDEARGLLGESA